MEVSISLQICLVGLQYLPKKKKLNSCQLINYTEPPLWHGNNGLQVNCKYVCIVLCVCSVALHLAQGFTLLCFLTLSCRHLHLLPLIERKLSPEKECFSTARIWTCRMFHRARSVVFTNSRVWKVIPVMFGISDCLRECPSYDLTHCLHLGAWTFLWTVKTFKGGLCRAQWKWQMFLFPSLGMHDPGFRNIYPSVKRIAEVFVCTWHFIWNWIWWERWDNSVSFQIKVVCVLSLFA